MSKTIKLRVTAPAGVRIPGLGSRRQGGIFEVDAEQAITLEAVPGLEAVQPSSARKSRPVETPEPVKETNGDAE